jgi:hypothetical protein
MQAERLADEEIVVRWVDRSSPDKFQPPDRISTTNFKLRAGESGLSVFRLSVRSSASILASETSGRGDYFFISAVVGEVRLATNAEGKPLDLDVIADEEGGLKPGHALIVGEFTKSVPKALRDLFQRLQD